MSRLCCDKCKRDILNTNLALLQWYQDKKVLPGKRKLKGFQIVHCHCSYNEIQMFEEKKRIWDGTIEYFSTSQGIEQLHHLIESQYCEDNEEVQQVIDRLKKLLS